jgi:hypothetical protein
MKTLLTTILLLLSLTVKAQQVDALYIPSQKSLVASYNYKQIGCYVGGYYVTTFPHPYIYTTPLTIVNRAGLTYVNKNNTFSIMGGAFIKAYFDNVELTPDIWVKVYPIRMITKDKTSLDFALGINYMDGFRFGVGVSIPYGSIYR